MSIETKPLYPSWMPRGKTLKSSWRNVAQWYCVYEFNKNNPNASIDDAIAHQRQMGFI